MTRFAYVVTLCTSCTADLPSLRYGMLRDLAARIERFVGLEHIEPENLP